MLPLDRCPPKRLARLRGLLADIDDTITTDGRLRADAYVAMESIQAAGLLLIPVTGRPAGWCDHIARMWPVDAVVGENGAFWFRYDHDARLMQRQFMADEHTRRIQSERLRRVAAEVLTQVPGAKISADQHYREADLAIDFCEDIERLSDTEIERIVAIMQGHGLTVKVSSIHVNGWFGSHDKLSTTRALMTTEFGRSESQLREEFAYIGDSPNDEPMFEFFDCTVGVANVADFAQRMRHLPRYVTDHRGGSGFAQFATALTGALAAEFRR
jgi:HAD superfamily hydrolase (TIGR01484 family)